jgi:4-amino-4-deoxy-L-arabinose transferase-like glycosyltransferase
MQKQYFTIALLITLVLAVTVTVWGTADAMSKAQLSALNSQLDRTHNELVDTKTQLADANNKLLGDDQDARSGDGVRIN